jgi:putative transposase
MVGRGYVPAEFDMNGDFMSQIPERWDGPNEWYFVSIVTKDRKPVFSDELACMILKQAFHEANKYYSFCLGALVILPDHWHGLIHPMKSVVIEQVVGAVKRVVLKGLGHKKSIWQTRFLDHRIRNEEDFLTHVEYIRFNPQKHGLINECDQYQWCFIHDRPFG